MITQTFKEALNFGSLNTMMTAMVRSSPAESDKGGTLVALPHTLQFIAHIFFPRLTLSPPTFPLCQ